MLGSVLNSEVIMIKGDYLRKGCDGEDDKEGPSTENIKCKATEA